MKSLLLAVSMLFAALAASAQVADRTVAVVGGQKINVSNLPDDDRVLFDGADRLLGEVRKEYLEIQIIDTLAEIEAAARKVTIPALFQAEVAAKVPNPSEAEIQRVYDVNRASIGNRPIAEVRDQIIEILRQEPEQKAFEAFINSLRAKYRAVPGKDVAGPGLKPTDVLVTLGTRPITVQEFEKKNAIGLDDARFRLYAAQTEAVEDAVFASMVAAEAKSLGTEPGDLLAREITDKLREFTDEERQRLESAFRTRLISKYKPQIQLTEPDPLVLEISTANRPVKGPATAPVTLVMFSDFQCGSCAAMHPVVGKILAEFPAQVKFVVKYFPLSRIHRDATRAAVAANAAFAQGKFFEFIDLLYKNQNALDAGSLKKYATAVGLNLPKFELDLQNEKTAADVKADVEEGETLRINGTPTFYVNGVKVRALSEQALRDAVRKALKK